MLELFEYTDPRGEPVPGERTQADNGFTHIGLDSDDTLGDYRRLLGLAETAS